MADPRQVYYLLYTFLRADRVFLLADPGVQLLRVQASQLMRPRLRRGTRKEIQSRQQQPLEVRPVVHDRVGRLRYPKMGSHIARQRPPLYPP